MSNNVNETLALVPKSELPEDYDNNNNSSKVIVDSLPYIDYLHPDYEAYALSLIEHEMKKDDTTKIHYKCNQHELSSSTNSIFLKNAPISQNEYKQLESNNGERLQDTTTFQKKIPESKTVLNPELKESAKILKIEIEKLRHDNINLQLQQIFESGQWRLYNTTLEEFSNRYQSIVDDKKRKIDDINAIRSSKQEAVYERLNKGHMMWADLVFKHCKLVVATNTLEVDVKKRRKELGISDKEVDGDNHDTEDTQ